MAFTVLVTTTASVSELKRDPMGTVGAGEGLPVAILNHNKPVFYCVPAKTFEAMLDCIEANELNRIAGSKVAEKIIKLTIDGL